MVNSIFWKGKRVLVTGHTGFKGSWLLFWLNRLQAVTSGYALDPASHQTLFDLLGNSEYLSDYRGNVEDFEKFSEVLNKARPEILIHLAAQALVRESYKSPASTFSTNVLGTMNALEIARHLDSVRVILIVTTDKCYENLETGRAFRENDSLGGKDPYSASKACAEIVTTAYRESFFSQNSRCLTGIASARAGNVIGGGDWATDRLVPDAIRSFEQGQPLTIRNPDATRPWQHVLDPLSGYLTLCENLWPNPGQFSGSWNFGPQPDGITTVGSLMDQVTKCYGSGARWQSAPPNSEFPEAKYLQLDTTKANTELKWAPQWTLNQTVHNTVDWYKSYQTGSNMRSISSQQLDNYVSLA